jgi:hypothetical protein
MQKFGFRIKTRGGLSVDNLIVQARDQEEAERKINQIYVHCQIVECKELHSSAPEEASDLEGIISLIAREEQNPSGDR